MQQPTQVDLITIIRSYRLYNEFHVYCRKVMDRFGYWDVKKLHEIPRYTDNTLENYSLERAKNLGYKNILWSGGIDSTFIICAYIKAKVPFSVVCDDRSIRDGTMFYEWMLKQGINIIKFGDICDAYKFEDLLHGDVADLLFSPDEKRRTTLPDAISFYENMNTIPDRDRLYNQVFEYGKLLDKPVDSNDHIIRLINFGSMYFHGRDELYYMIFPVHKLVSFFDTAEFNNIAFTQYWDRTILDDKPEMHRFICDVTQDERMMWGVYRSPTRLVPRLERTPSNFKRWE